VAYEQLVIKHPDVCLDAYAASVEGREKRDLAPVVIV
jgi:hypothetical protein